MRKVSLRWQDVRVGGREGQPVKVFQMKHEHNQLVKGVLASKPQREYRPGRDRQQEDTVATCSEPLGQELEGVGLPRGRKA